MIEEESMKKKEGGNIQPVKDEGTRFKKKGEKMCLGKMRLRRVTKT